jgi:hypothetical protein
VKSAERPEQGLDRLPASSWQPAKAVSRDGDRELFLHLRSGRSLTLAEYVRAEEVLAASSPWRARTTVGALSLASEGWIGSALRTGRPGQSNQIVMQDVPIGCS